MEICDVPYSDTPIQKHGIKDEEIFKLCNLFEKFYINSFEMMKLLLTLVKKPKV